MPFRLDIAPQVFQRWVDGIFEDLKDLCVVYIYDILAFSNSIEEHKKYLKILISKLQKHGIVLSPKKIEIEKTKLDFLGITLNQDDLKLQDHIISKIKDFDENIQDNK